MDEECGLETLVREKREISCRFLGKVWFILDLVAFCLTFLYLPCKQSFHISQNNKQL